jgi:hypothetical protein
MPEIAPVGVPEIRCRLGLNFTFAGFLADPTGARARER